MTVGGILALPRIPDSWLPHTLRRQFLLAVAALTLLILAGGTTAIFALRTSSATIRLLTAERLTRMQEAQDLVQRTLLIERESYHLADAESLAEMQASYGDIVRQLAEFDGLVDRLAADAGGSALLDLHQSSQLFRNTANVVAQLREYELRSAGDDTPPVPPSAAGQPKGRYLRELRRQADALVSAAQFQSEHFNLRYRQAVQQLDEVTRRNVQWVTLLLAGSLVLAWAVARWFLGWHVLGRLQQVSRDLRLGDGGATAPEHRRSIGRRLQVRDEIDEMAHAVALFQEDRRQLGQRTIELLLARDAAEAASKAKSAFLANMSHELRTPLNAILGFSSLMSSMPDMSDKQRETLEIINRSGEHLLTLINDVLEIAKIEAGKLQLESAAFDLGAMVREVAEMMRLRAEQKGLRLVLDQSSDFPRYVKGDEARLRQIVVNLLSNAVKFTAEGGVTVRLGVKDDVRNHLLLEVEDTGPGINPDQQERLFQPFVQFGEEAARSGTGLGLAIARQFAQLMGGDITIDSVPGKGSRFRVDLPLELASEDEVRQSGASARGDVVELAPGQPVYRILIAEDQPENRQLLERLMVDLGLEVKTAGNGEHCLRVFQDWHPHLIWMDQRMPVMDGLEATRRIRRLPNGKAVKIVAVTASVFKEEQSKMLAAGIDDLIRKPFRFGEIYDCLGRQLGIEFVYLDKAPATTRVRETLTPERLAALPAALRTRFRRDLESLDGERIDATAHEIAALDAELGDILSGLIAYFDYPSILDALDALARQND